MPRKKPFGTKQKKAQLQARRQRKLAKQAARAQADSEADTSTVEEATIVLPPTGSGPAAAGGAPTPPSGGGAAIPVHALNAQPAPRANSAAASGKLAFDPNRYNLKFKRESKQVIEKRKRQSRLPVDFLDPEDGLEMGLDDVYEPGSVLDLPRRPKWSFDMSKEKIDAQEQRAMHQYLEQIHAKYDDERLSYFEHNLETWRQLWRVMEISDVLLLLVDIRYAALHFPPPLYDYIVTELRKPLILILNKCDLVGEETTRAWEAYFHARFPALQIVTFSSFRTVHRGNPASRARRRKRLTLAIGVDALIDAWDEMGLPGGDEWRAKVQAEKEALQQQIAAANVPHPDYDGDMKRRKRFPGQPLGAHFLDEAEASSEAEGSGGEEEESALCDADGAAAPGTAPADGELDLEPEPDLGPPGDGGGEEAAGEKRLARILARFEARGYITLGLLGQPNVGKSTVLNSLVGKHVVGASRTPGHTKHFQTYFMTPKLRLCDCPGLIFPSLVPRQLQILAGLYPISQVQEPYTAIQYLVERVQLVEILKLTKSPPGKWSAWEICEGWAVQRGYFTAKAGRPDAFRSANDILRHVVDGRIVLSLKPPGFFETHQRQHYDEAPHDGPDGDGMEEELRTRPKYVPLRQHQTLPEPLAATDSDGGSSDSDEAGGEGGARQAASNPFELLAID